MARGENRDPRRWIRHFRDLRNLREAFPTGSADPNAPQVISPWLSDIVQPVFLLTPDFRVFPVTSPAAGAEFTLTVPEGVIFKLLSIRARLVADANAANRFITFIVTSNAGQVVFHTAANAAQSANQTRRYCAAQCGFDYGALTTLRTAPLTSDLWLRTGFTFTSEVLNIQVGDQWSEITALVEAWPSI